MLEINNTIQKFINQASCSHLHCFLPVQLQQILQNDRIQLQKVFLLLTDAAFREPLHDQIVTGSLPQDDLAERTHHILFRLQTTPPADHNLHCPLDLPPFTVPTRT